MIMKLEALVNVVVSMSSRLPERVAMLTAVSSVRPPPKIWTVSKTFSVSNLENCKNLQSEIYQTKARACAITFPHVTSPIFRSGMFETRAYDVKGR